MVKQWCHKYGAGRWYDDLLGEALLTAAKLPDACEAYLATAIRNSLLKWVEREKKHQHDALPADITQPEYDNSLREALAAETDPVVVQRIQGKSVSEIARTLNISRGTVNKRLQDARDRIKQQICE